MESEEPADFFFDEEGEQEGEEEKEEELPQGLPAPAAFIVPDVTKRKKTEIPVQEFGGGVTLEYLGDGRFATIIVRDPNGYFDIYSEYFNNLLPKKKKKEEEEPQTRIWSYPASREIRVKELLRDIISGKLPPPHLQPSVQVTPVNLNNPGLLAIPSMPVTSSQIQILELSSLSQIEPQLKPKPKVPPPPSVAPNRTTLSAYEAIQSMTNPQLVPLAGPIAKPKKAIRYDPTARAPGEADSRYQIRLASYNRLVGQGFPATTADLLSRMKDNMEFEGVEYSVTGTNFVKQYLS